MDENRKTRLKKQLKIGGISVGLGALAVGLWQISQSPPPPQSALTPPPQQTPLFPQMAAEREKPKTIIGELQVSPASLTTGIITLGQGSYSGSFSLRALHRPVTIRQITISLAQQSGIKLDTARCVGKTLAVDETCTVDVLFDPADPVRVDKQISVHAESDNSDGSRKALDRVVPLSAEAVNPPPPPQKPQVIVQAGPAEDTRVNPALASYLQNRSNLGGFDNEMGIGPLTPEADSWSEVGFGRSTSTFPTDLTRVVTMDKPIPAVLKIGLDTRYSNRAVAQVERDIYGGEGRLIVIPRGSTVIGTVGASGSTGEEKVQIQWTRIQRPDGAVFAIEAYGGDAMGRPGAPAYIDNRYLERYGMSLLTTVLNVGVTLGLDGKQTVQNSGNSNFVGGQFGVNNGYNNNQAIVQQDARAVATQQANQYLQGITADLQKEGQQIAPIRTVPPGTRLTIFPSRDLYLKPINPTKEMRDRLIAERARNTMAAPDMTQAAQQGRQAPVSAVQQPTAPTSTSRASVTYDPVTGQPIVSRPAQDRPILDANGFPILAGNMGLQPTISARPVANQPANQGSGNLTSSVTLNGTDPSAAQLRQQAQPTQQAARPGAAPWSVLNE